MLAAGPRSSRNLGSRAGVARAAGVLPRAAGVLPRAARPVATAEPPEAAAAVAWAESAARGAAEPLQAATAAAATAAAAASDAAAELGVAAVPARLAAAPGPAAMPPQVATGLVRTEVGERAAVAPQRRSLQLPPRWSQTAPRRGPAGAAPDCARRLAAETKPFLAAGTKELWLEAEQEEPPPRPEPAPAGVAMFVVWGPGEVWGLGEAQGPVARPRPQVRPAADGSGQKAPNAPRHCRLTCLTKSPPCPPPSSANDPSRHHRPDGAMHPECMVADFGGPAHDFSNGARYANALSL